MDLKRPLDGVLLLDKPPGISSNHALQRVKRLFHALKAGHTGSLDPLASGMLPICFGKATRFSHYGLEADKIYEVSAQLGCKTTTGDAEGTVISTRPVPYYDLAALMGALEKFRGASTQIPPMYSALKYQGQPLYRLARQGVEVPRPPRAIYISELEGLDYDAEMFRFRVQCSKGTYIRTLVEDLGEQLGCGAHVVALRRLSVSTFKNQPMYALSSLIEAYQPDSVDSLDHYLLPLSIFQDKNSEL